MKVDIRLDSESGLIHSMATKPTGVHDLTPAAEVLHGDSTVFYKYADYQGIEKHPERQGLGIGLRIAMHSGKRRALPVTPERRVADLVETDKAYIRAKVGIRSVRSNVSSAFRRPGSTKCSREAAR